MLALRRNARRYETRRLAREIHDAAACLSACRIAICDRIGLSAEQWRALAAIERSDFVLSISDLARKLRRSRQSAHPLALGLERVGWIRFLPNRSDRRLLQMEITDLGKSILSAVEGGFSAWLLTMASDLSDGELRELATILRAVRERIAEARDYA
jgi:DNA-binding MarR family transcriptional regulator